MSTVLTINKIVSRIKENIKYIKGMLESNKNKLEKYSPSIVDEDIKIAIQITEAKDDVLSNKDLMVK